MGFRKKLSRRQSSQVSSSGSDAGASSSEVDAQIQQPPIKLPSLDCVPSLINDLVNLKNVSSDRAAKVLKKLFSVSEHDSFVENRIKMVRVADAQLVPALLDFLMKTEKGSNEQYLALLVINNISIPMQNKRLVGLNFGAVKILSRLLCEDPSCHLIAIILVNLTFSDAKLRSELVSTPGIDLVESLSFALRVASLTQEEYEHRQPLVEADPDDHQKSVSELLKNLLAEDQRQRLENLSSSSNSSSSSMYLLPKASEQLFPSTARWAMSAIKNLTRPSKDASAAHELIRVGIIPHIFRFITVANTGIDRTEQQNDDSCHSEDNTPEPTEPLCQDFEYNNSPTTWDAHSAQDAALFIIMNLSAIPSAREYMRDIDAIQLLSVITTCHRADHKDKHPFVEEEILEFQRLKARMALAYLVGSEGHFGQPPVRSCASAISYVNQDDHVLIVTEPEVTRLVELLATTLHHRSKEGAGGYSAATFTLKYVLFAIRCLLTNYENQIRVSNTQATQLNTLLVKVLAHYALRNATYVDAEAAEHACFSLYLLSNYCFRDITFLPDAFGSPKVIDSLAAKILTAYQRHQNITPAGKHAVDQLLLRLHYLTCYGTARDLAVCCGSNTTASDFELDKNLTKLSMAVHVQPHKPGAQPDDNIFDRPLLRRRAFRKAGWDAGSIDYYPNALQAAQEFSFASTKVRHMDAIDDVLIANNIVHSANGDKTGSYNYQWTWQDAAGELMRCQRSSDSLFGGSHNGRDATLSALGMLDNLCGSHHES